MALRRHAFPRKPPARDTFGLRADPSLGAVVCLRGSTRETHHEQTSNALARAAVRAGPSPGGEDTREVLGGRAAGRIGLAGAEVRMTHTYFHARSSARIWGGEPEDYLPVHDWMDATKRIFCDFRHRALRHHAEGIFVGEEVFGSTIRNSAGKQVPVRYVLEQHCIEDSGRIPTARDWLELMPLPEWLSASADSASETYAHAEASADRWGGEPEDYLPVHDWLDETQRAFCDPRHMTLRHHAEGLFFCEERLGKVIVNAGRPQGPGPRDRRTPRSA